MSKVVVWDNLLDQVMNIPMVSISRDEFLKEKLSPCGADVVARAIETNPLQAIGKERVAKLAQGVISHHTTLVTGASALAGMPGGLALLGTVPADLAQYMCHVLLVAQKLAYLYGYPDFKQNGTHLSDDTRTALTIFVGVMLGAEAAGRLVRELSLQVAKQTAKRLPQMALTKTVWYPIVKNVSKWIGVKMTKDVAAKSISKVVPILGGIVSGVLTYATFSPSAKKLHRSLSEGSDLFMGSLTASK